MWGGRPGWCGARAWMALSIAATTSACGLLGQGLSDDERGAITDAVAGTAADEILGRGDRDDAPEPGRKPGGGSAPRDTELRIQWGPDPTAPLSGHVTYRSLLAHWLYGVPIYEPSLTVTPVLGVLEGLPLVSRDVMARGIAPGIDPFLGEVGPGAWYFFLSGRGYLVGVSPGYTTSGPFLPRFGSPYHGLYPAWRLHLWHRWWPPDPPVVRR